MHVRLDLFWDLNVLLYLVTGFLKLFIQVSLSLSLKGVTAANDELNWDSLSGSLRLIVLTREPFRFSTLTYSLFDITVIILGRRC